MNPFIDLKIEDYCMQHSSLPSEACEEIYAYTQKNIKMSQMMVGPFEGSFLGFLISMTQAKRVLEVGCFTGYSALSMAERLPDDGELITLDINADNVALAQSFWDKSPHGKKIKAVVGPALDSLQNISDKFDLVFIDADKKNYQNYFDRVLPLLSSKGFIVVDNCLWGGDVLKAGGDGDTQALKAFNEAIHERSDLEKVLLPLRDGVFLIRKM